MYNAECLKHPGVQAVDRCTGCAESFCADCLVEIHGRKYCASCKVMTVDMNGPLPAPKVLQPNKLAQEALIFSTIGIFCFGILLGPIGISKALEAKRMIKADPTLGGDSQATIAILMGVIGIVIFVSSVLSSIASLVSAF